MLKCLILYELKIENFKFTWIYIYKVQCPCVCVPFKGGGDYLGFSQTHLAMGGHRSVKDVQTQERGPSSAKLNNFLL